MTFAIHATCGCKVRLYDQAPTGNRALPKKSCVLVLLLLTVHRQKMSHFTELDWRVATCNAHDVEDGDIEGAQYVEQVFFGHIFFGWPAV